MKDLFLRDKISDVEQRANFEIIKNAIENIENNWLQKIYNPMYWDDQQVNISSTRLPVANAPVWTNFKGTQVLGFRNAFTNTIYFIAQFTHEYAQGTDFSFHVHIAHPTAGAGVSKWVFTYSMAAPLYEIDSNSTGFPAQTTETVYIDAPGIIDLNQSVDIVETIDGSNAKASTKILCSLARRGADIDDTYASDVYLLGLDFHIKKDAPGSLEENYK